MTSNIKAAYALWGVGICLVVGALLSRSIKILMGVFLTVGITACVIGSILYLNEPTIKSAREKKAREKKDRTNGELGGLLMSGTGKSVPMLTKSLRLIKDYSVTQTYQEIKDLLTSGAAIKDVSTFSIQNLVITTTDGTVLTADDCFGYEYTGDDITNTDTFPAKLAFSSTPPQIAMAPCTEKQDTATKISITYNFTAPQDIQRVSFINASSTADAPVILGVTVQFINAYRTVLKEVPISSFTDAQFSFTYP